MRAIILASKQGENAMDKVESINDILLTELKDLYSAEAQITKALPKVIKKVSSTELKRALTEHLDQTRGQLARLERIGEILDENLSGEKCEAMEGLVSEGEEVMELSDDPGLTDALIISACQRIEHYEMAGYGTARAIAEQLGLDDVVGLLQDTLDEEGDANERLTDISEGEILPSCSAPSEEEWEAEEEEEIAPVTAKKPSKSPGKTANR